MTATNFPEIFIALRAILLRHAGRLTIAEDSTHCFRLEGGIHPIHKKAFPIAWVLINKNYVSFHHMAVYARPELLQDISAGLRDRMQGKSCFNFKNIDTALFAELEQLTLRGFDAFRDTRMMKPSNLE
jgi:hypothetical protein